MIVMGYRVGPLLKKTWREIGEDQIGLLAGSAAYNFFFSIFPILLFLAPLLSVIGNERATFDFIMRQLVVALPPDQIPPFETVVRAVVFSSGAPGLISVGLLLAAWGGSNIVGTLMGALNEAYNVRETRSWLKQQGIRFLHFLLSGFIVIVATVIILNGEGIANFVGNLLHLGPVFVFVWKVIQFPLALLFMTLLAAFTYYLLPNVKQRPKQVFAAALVTTFLWLVATFIFRLYVQHFPPNKAYGVLGAVIILNGWLYYCMFVLLAGGELASELHDGTGAVAPEKGDLFLGRIVSDAGPGISSTP